MHKLPCKSITYRGNAPLNHPAKFDKAIDVNALVKNGNKVFSDHTYLVYRVNNIVNRDRAPIYKGVNCDISPQAR